MTPWHNSDHIPSEWEPFLCDVFTPKGRQWEVLWYHPRKKWVFNDGLELSPTHKVVQFKEIRILSREVLD